MLTSALPTSFPVEPLSQRSTSIDNIPQRWHKRSDLVESLNVQVSAWKCELYHLQLCKSCFLPQALTRRAPCKGLSVFVQIPPMLKWSTDSPGRQRCKLRRSNCDKGCKTCLRKSRKSVSVSLLLKFVFDAATRC
jgi:hypothetical protein